MNLPSREGLDDSILRSLSLFIRRGIDPHTLKKHVDYCCEVWDHTRTSDSPDSAAHRVIFFNEDPTREVTSSFLTTPSRSSGFAPPPTLSAAPPPPPPPDPKESLTGSQVLAYEKIEAWLGKNRERRQRGKAIPRSKRCFVLKGYAGSGKSHLLGVLRSSVFRPFPTIFAAPTHKAAAVLSEFVREPVSTLASILGVKVNNESEEVKFELPESFPEIPAGSILVIDESSMVGRDYLGFLLLLAEERDIYLFFIGDPAQLPPVGEARSPVWRLVEEEDLTHTLTDVRRYSGPILALATSARRCVFSKEAVLEVEETEQTVRSFGKSFERTVLSNVELFSKNEARFIAWRNRTVDRVGLLLRKELGYTDDFNVGEIMSLRSSFVDLSGKEQGSTDAEVRIDSITESSWSPSSNNVEIPCYTLAFSGHVNASARALHPDYANQFALTLNRMAADAREEKNSYLRKQKWSLFWSTKKSVVTLRPAISLTSHRAQGSQTKHAFVDAHDISSNPTRSERYRCLYTAFTRAQERIITNV